MSRKTTADRKRTVGILPGQVSFKNRTPCMFVYILYLTMLPVAQTIQRRIIELLVNNKFQEHRRKRLWPNLRVFTGVCSGVQRNTTNISRYHVSRFKIRSALFKTTDVFLVAQQPLMGQCFTVTPRHTCIRQDSSRRVISPTQRPLPDNTQHS